MNKFLEDVYYESILHVYERLTDKGLQPYFGEYDYLKIKEKKQQAS